MNVAFVIFLSWCCNILLVVICSIQDLVWCECIGLSCCVKILRTIHEAFFELKYSCITKSSFIVLHRVSQDTILAHEGRILQMICFGNRLTTHYINMFWSHLFGTLEFVFLTLRTSWLLITDVLNINLKVTGFLKAFVFIVILRLVYVVLVDEWIQIISHYWKLLQIYIYSFEVLMSKLSVFVPLSSVLFLSHKVL